MSPYLENRLVFPQDDPKGKLIVYIWNSKTLSSGGQSLTFIWKKNVGLSFAKYFTLKQ